MNFSFLKEKFMALANLAIQLARHALKYPVSAPVAERGMNCQLPRTV